MTQSTAGQLQIGGWRIWRLVRRRGLSRYLSRQGLLSQLGGWLASMGLKQSLPPSSGRYFAFLSYRNAGIDKAEAIWLHSAIETYKLPQTLAGRLNRRAGLGKVFRDSDDLSASPHLWADIVKALEQSENLIVFCSPRSVQSKWVNDEVEEFLRLGRRSRIFAVLIEGEPADVFPPALLRVSSAGTEDVATSIERRDEPLAADLRVDPETYRSRTRRTALLRLIAGILGVGFDDLRNREQERQVRRLTFLISGAIVVLAIVSGLAVFSEFSRREAERQRLTAVANEAVSLARLGDDAWTQNKILDAEIDYASSLGVNDTAAVRESLLRVRARGIQRLWETPSAIGGRTVLVSVDGTEVVAAHEDQLIRVWGVADGSVHAVLSGHSSGITALALSPDGQKVMSGDFRGAILIHSRADGTLLAEYTPTQASIIAVGFDRDGNAYSITSDNVLTRRGGDGIISAIEIPGASIGAAVIRPDGPNVVVGDKNGFVRTIDPQTGADLAALKVDSLAIEAMALSQTGEFLAAWGSSDRYNGSPVPCMCVRIRNLTTGALVAEQTVSSGFPMDNGLAFSPDGRMLAIAGLSGASVWTIADGQVVKESDTALRGGVAFASDSRQLYAIGENLARLDPASMRDLGWLSGHAGSVQALAYAPDGKTFASADLEGLITIRDTSGSEVRRLPPNAEGYLGLSFDPSGRWLLACTFDGAVQIWDLEATPAIPVEARLGGVSTVQQCASADPRGGRLAVQHGADVRFLSLAGEFEAGTELLQAGGNGLAFSADGSKLAVASRTGSIAIYTSAYNGLSDPMTLAPTLSRQESMKFSPDGQLLAALSNDALIIWRLDTPSEPIHQIPLRSGAQELAFSPDGQQVAVSTFGAVVIVDAVAGRIVAQFNPNQLYEGYLSSLAIDPSGGTLIVGAETGVILAYSLGSGRETRTIRPPDRAPDPNGYSFTPAVAYSPTAQVVAISGYDRSLRLYDPASGRLVDRLTDGEFSLRRGVVFSADGLRLMGGSATGVVRLLDIADHRERVVEVARPDQPVDSVTISADGSRLAFATHASGAADFAESTDIVLWNLKENRAETVLTGHGRTVLSMAFHPSKPILASASYDTTARLWNLDNPGEFLELDGHGGSVTSIEFSPDGARVATAARDGFVRIFDTITAKRLRTLPAARQTYVEAVSFIPGSGLLVASGDGGTYIWETATWRVVHHLDGHDDQWVQHAAVDPAGKWLLTTSQDSYIRIWDLAELAKFKDATASSIVADSVSRTGRRALIAN